MRPLTHFYHCSVYTRIQNRSLNGGEGQVKRDSTLIGRVEPYWTRDTSMALALRSRNCGVFPSINPHSYWCSEPKFSCPLSPTEVVSGQGGKAFIGSGMYVLYVSTTLDINIMFKSG